MLATQNSLDTEGTYPLPEAQLDRFLLKIDMTYPTLSEEVDIVTRTTTDQTGEQLPLAGVTPVLNERGILALQHLVARQRVDAAVTDYAVRIARATRDWPGIAHWGRLARTDRAHTRGQGGGADGGALLRHARRRQIDCPGGVASPDCVVGRCATRWPKGG